MPWFGSGAAVALGACLLIGCGRTARSEQNADQGRSGATDQGSAGAADRQDTDSGSAGAAPGVADNGVMIPVRDPRNSCDGLGLKLGACDASGHCDSLSCACPNLTPVATRIPCAAGCVGAIDCAALCGLDPDVWSVTEYFCMKGLCESDAGCTPSQHCVKPPNAQGGSCTDRGTGMLCFADGDCLSGACVVTDDSGQGRCDAAGRCNRARQCGEKKCVILPDHYVGSCSDGNVDGPCVTAEDCTDGLGCAAGRPDFITGPLGACTDGSDGSPCAVGRQCLPGWVCDGRQGRCYASALGEPCNENADCPDGFCSTADESECTTGEEDESCADATQCQTPFCAAGRCSSGKPGRPCVEPGDCVHTCVEHVCSKR